MKLDDYKGEDAIDLLADILEPVSVIVQDEEVRSMINTPGTPYVIIARNLLKSHKKEIMEIMALIDGEDVENYSPGFFELPMKLVEIIKLPEMKELFI